MHLLAARRLVESVRRRESQGDRPTEPALSVETLEDLVITLADQLTRVPPASAPAATPEPEDRIHSGPECVRCGRREVWHPDGSCHVFHPKPAAPTAEEAEAPHPCCMCGSTDVEKVTEERTGAWGKNMPVTYTDTCSRCRFCGERWYSSDEADASFRALWKATITAQATALAALQARVEELETPDSFWLADDPEVNASDPQEFMDMIGVDEVAKVLTGRSLPTMWVAHVRIPETETSDEESEIQLHATEDEAHAALAPRQPTGSQP